MSEEEILRKKLERIHENSHYGIMIDTEITNIVRSHIKRLEEATMHADCEFCRKRNICTRDVPKPCKYKYTEEERIADQASDKFGAILHNTYLPSTYHKKEETTMESTSTDNFHDVIAIDFELQTFPNPDVQDKFIVSATNRDDIFCFVFEGPHLADACRKTGLFDGWEKDQKIRELEEEVKRWKKEAADCLKLRDEVIIEKNKEINELNQKLQQVVRDEKRLTYKYEDLKNRYNLEKCANEAQRKFINEYAGKGVEIKFNYAIDDVKEVSYVIVDKEEYDKNFKKWLDAQVEQDSHTNTRSDILDLAKKCVCGKREQDYGTPESNFQLIADLWNQYLFKEPGAKEVFGIGPMDVAMMMGLMKIARIRNGGGSGDSFVDLAGYAACGGEIWHSNQETNGDSN